MSKPYSFQNEPFLAFVRGSDSLFTSWFVHDRFLAVNFSQLASKGTISLNAWLAGKPDSLYHHESIGVWFPAWSRGGTLYFKSFGGLLRLHYDDGVHPWQVEKGRTINPFFNIQCDKNLKNIVLKAGANIISPQWNAGSRIRYALNEGQGQISIATRQEWTNGPWIVAGYKSINVNHLCVLTNAVKVGYQYGDHDFFFTAEQNQHRDLRKFRFISLESYFNEFRADLVKKIDELTKAGLEVEFSLRGITNITTALSRSIISRNAALKLRLSTNKSVAVSYRGELRNYGTWALGLEIADLGRSNSARYGAELNLNI